MSSEQRREMVDRKHPTLYMVRQCAPLVRICYALVYC